MLEGGGKEVLYQCEPTNYLPSDVVIFWCEQDQVKRESDMNLLLRAKTQVPMVRADVVKTHNYSTQTLNSTELANEALRQILKEVSDTGNSRQCLRTAFVRLRLVCREVWRLTKIAGSVGTIPDNRPDTLIVVCSLVLFYDELSPVRYWQGAKFRQMSRTRPDGRTDTAVIVCSLVLFHASFSPVRYWQGLRFQQMWTTILDGNTRRSQCNPQ